MGSPARTITEQIQTTFAPLTTPFVQRQECETIADLTSYGTWDSVQKSMIAASGIISWEGNPAYSACQPSGWLNNIWEGVTTDFPWRTYYFSPAVCPSGWTPQTSGVALTNNNQVAPRKSLRIVTTAYCCRSGFSINDNIYMSSGTDLLRNPCESTFGADDSTSHIATSTGYNSLESLVTLTSGFLVHPAMKIQWKESDIPSLTPQPAIVSHTLTQPPVTVAPLTTPFVQPANCSKIRDYSSAVSYFWNDKEKRLDSSARPLIFSWNANPAFAACQPPGWDQYYRLSFSPAVCPYLWTTVAQYTTKDWLATTTATRSEDFTYHAYCCQSGYSASEFTQVEVQYAIDWKSSYVMNHKCASSFGPSATQTATLTADMDGKKKGEEIIVSSGLLVHEAITIEWQGKDLASLTPAPTGVHSQSLSNRVTAQKFLSLLLVGTLVTWIIEMVAF